MDDGHTHGASFPATPWTQLALAAGGDTLARASLDRICELYWAPLYAYARRNGAPPVEAEDITQSFFMRLLGDETMTQADRAKGKLRSYLLGALKHFMINWRRDQHAVKRGGKLQRVDFDTSEVEAVCAAGREDGLTPDAFFERRWAVTLLDHAMRDLETEQSRLGNTEQFKVLGDFILMHGKEADHSAPARQLRMNEGAVRVAVHRLRKRFRELVRMHVAATVGGEAEVDQELRHLISLYAS